jgi:hypothetical protein
MGKDQPTVTSLAADFEAAWKAENDLPADATDEQIVAAVARTNVCVEKILEMSGANIQILRLKALAHIWAHGMPEDDSALASLFRDLGVDCPVAAHFAP